MCFHTIPSSPFFAPQRTPPGVSCGAALQNFLGEGGAGGGVGSRDSRWKARLLPELIRIICTPGAHAECGRDRGAKTKSYGQRRGAVPPPRRLAAAGVAKRMAKRKWMDSGSGCAGDTGHGQAAHGKSCQIPLNPGPGRCELPTPAWAAPAGKSSHRRRRGWRAHRHQHPLHPARSRACAVEASTDRGEFSIWEGTVLVTLSLPVNRSCTPTEGVSAPTDG
eukprot:gene14612-biopygen3610